MDEPNTQVTKTETTDDVQATKTETTDDIFLAEQTAVKETPKKANPFVQIIKGLAYFLFFLAAQIIATFIVMIGFGIKKAYEYAAMGMQPADAAREVAAYMESQTLSNTNLILFINAALLVLPLMIIFAIRRKNFFVETHIQKFSPKLLPVLFLILVGLVLFVNSVLNLLPASWMASYATDSSFINEGSLVASLIAQALCAPLTEELTFRGLMLSRFNKGLPVWVGITISSLLFGLIHGNFIWFIYAALLGATFCLIAIRTGSIIPTIMIHALFNAFGTGLSYARIGFNIPIFIVCALVGFGILSLSLFWFFEATKKTA